jgi:hypothetical protein
VKENWPEITGALLAMSKGHADAYARKWSRHEDGVFMTCGSSAIASSWQELLRGKFNESPHPANAALMDLLDYFYAQSGDVNALVSIQQSFLQSASTPKDWRYYFVKYPVMRGAPQGFYVLEKSCYRACMLKGERVATFWDPFLLALVEEAGYSKKPDHFSVASWPLEFYGTQDETGKRQLKLAKSSITIECVEDGWQLGNPPTEDPRKTAFDHACRKHGILADLLLKVTPDGNGFDSIDRISLGAKLLQDLVAI